jgi:assimilatory nitrate reductase catalytic subunit
MLPAAMWGEKEGTYTNSERRVSKVNRAVPPPGEARADFDIFLGLADRLGVRDEIFPGWTRPGDAFEEWKRVSAGRLCDYSGMTYKAIEQFGGLQWPLPAGEAPTPDARRLYTDGGFKTDDGRARLLPAAWEPFPEQPTGEYPFVLNTGRTVEHWHTRTKTSKVPILEHLSPHAWVEMNPADARALRLKPQARVDIVSRRGRVSSVELRVTETVAPGQLFVPFHYFEANANQVTQSAFDPFSREPNYKQSAVRIEAATRESRQAPPVARHEERAVGNRLSLARFWRGSTIPSLSALAPAREGKRGHR